MDKFQLASDWSPDGKRVVGECAGPKAGICELDPVEGTVKTLFVHSTDQLLYPSWSWDGRAIAFMRRRSPADCSIVIAPVTRDGTLGAEDSWVEISRPQTENSRPRFSPDGGIVYYIMGRGGQRLLVAQRVDKTSRKPAGDLVQLVRTPLELTAVTGAAGPYPLINVTPKRLFYSNVNERATSG